MGRLFMTEADFTVRLTANNNPEDATMETKLFVQFKNNLMARGLFKSDKLEQSFLINATSSSMIEAEKIGIGRLTR